MIKKSLKARNIFKGAVFGVALVMCGSFVPVGALQVLAETWKETSDEQQVSNNTNRIEIAGDSYQNVVEKGEEFSIPTASYYGKSTSPHIIGSAVSPTITESKVVAYYEADNQIVYDSSKDEYSGYKFEATRIGTYVVEYTVVDNGIKYSHKIELKCIVNEVVFNFDSNSANIIPSIYDLSLMQDEKKDIVLPIPTVEDEDDNAFENLKIYLDGEDATEQEYLKISLDNAFSSDVKIQKDSDGNFYIDGDSLVGANGHEFRIIYKFYQNGVQVASTEKTFKVYDKYYTQKDGKAGYSLSIPKLTYPTSAVVGEPTKVKLPTAIATTSDDDSPANESVNVSYKIEVYKEGKDNNWNLIEENTIDEENRFIAPSEGNYKFVYVVTDFYGHESRDFTFYIRNVKDTSPATPYMYDAGDTNAENEDGSYKSAESILKSQTVNRNIIIYAIGGNDNAVSKEDLTLTREVRNATGSVIYKITSYNEYNLIFQPSKDGTEGKGLYKSIYDDNYQIRRQMILGGETRIDEETIKQWLIDHNYLIVVSDRVTSPTGEQFKDDGSEMTDEELLAEGFAYIEANSSNAKFTEQTYSVYYIADDNVDGNGSKEIYFNFEVKSSVEDSVAPVILHSTEFQSSYLENDVINSGCTILSKLLNRDIIYYPINNNELYDPTFIPAKKKSSIEKYLTSNEKGVAQWVAIHNKHAGATTQYLPNSKCLYYAIRNNKIAYGVIGINLDNNRLTSIENRILLAILGEMTLSLNNIRSIKEKNEAILRVKNEQLRADLLRSISHDLRTPLTSIYGNADILLNDNNMLSDEKKKVLYGDIYDDALWLFNLVENLLSITKIEDGKMKLRIEPQMLEEVIETALKHVSRNKKYYQILINLKNEYLMADMDARLIIQVLINIIDNAIKYTPVGSLIEIIAYQKEKTVFVEIRDNGDGIPDEEKTNVFDKFYSLNKTVIDSKKSIGLGLSLCKSIIEAHGGTIFVTDNHPKGSIFTFTLPATEITIDKNIL